jgi:hypothetical protein
MTHAEGYADHAMRQIGHVPPALLAKCPDGLLLFTPNSLADERAKNDFANTARLICVAYSVTATVLVVESWMKLAKPGDLRVQDLTTGRQLSTLPGWNPPTRQRRASTWRSSTTTRRFMVSLPPRPTFSGTSRLRRCSIVL